MSDILLATKIHIPPLHRNLVNRPHLIQRLNDGIEHNSRLTLISAPAGYGKSSLLSEWVSQIDLPVAWLSLEKGENTPARFWNYFITALDSVPFLHQAGLGESVLPVLQSTQPPPVEALLTNLVNDLSKLEGGAVLVLDDLHAITEGQIHQGLIFLIDHLPRSANGLHLVVAGRMDPPWPLARWRVRDELTELRASDLRFSFDEVFQLLNQTMQLQLSSQDITALQERTEGWIAGLQMAGVSMQGRLKAQGPGGVSHFIETFTGSNRFILDYLVEEVINQQPLEIRDFLYATSILEQLTAPLCDAVTGRVDSQAILDQMEQANLFLVALDEERRWYRYHYLFNELLRLRLKQTRPDQITPLHLRASHWYAENNMLSVAILHAIEAGDFLRVNEFVSGNALAIVEHSELLDVQRHFEELPDQQIVSQPWLCVAFAWVKAYADPSRGMDRVLQQAEQSLTRLGNASERNHLASHLDAIRSYVAWVKGEADEAVKFARLALENLPEGDWVTRSHILNIEGLARQYQFDMAGAVQSLEAAIVAGQNTGKLYETFYATANLAYIYLLLGKLHQAHSLCQQVIHSADQLGQESTHLPVLAYAYATLSLVQIEWNQVESAILNARQSLALAEGWNQADTLHYTLTCLFAALCAAGDFEEAASVNQRSMQLATHVSSWFVRISTANEILLNLTKGDIPAAARRFAELEAMVDERIKLGTFLVIKTSLLYAQGRFADVVAAVEEAVDELKRRDGIWILMTISPLQALALQALGREEEALNIIGPCLSFAASQGFVRIFVEHGAPMLKLLGAVLHRGIEPEYIKALLPAFNTPDAAPKSSVPVDTKIQPQSQGADLFEPLSRRELEVLRLLDSRLTSEEIARELFLSVNTVRTHIRNIYSKLAVHGRIEAIQKAREIGLF